MKKIILTLLIASAAFMTSAHRAAAQGKDVALETIGAVSGLAVYNTYIAIGAIADGYSDDGYDEEYVNSLMDEQIGALESITAQLKDLQKSGFITDPADNAYIDKFLAAVADLKNEARGLKELVDGQGEELYKESRDKAWKGISELLGLEDE